MKHACNRTALKIFSVAVSLSLILGVCLAGIGTFAASAAAPSVISEYIADFEGNYYNGPSAANWTAGSIVEENDGKALRFDVKSASETARFEIYNSGSGIFKLNDGSVYAVTITYKVTEIANAQAAESGTMINLVRYSGSGNQLVRVKAFPDSVYNPGDTTDWVTRTVVFQANISASAQYDRLAINVVSPSCPESDNGVDETTILFDDIIVEEYPATAKAIVFSSNGGTACKPVIAEAGAAIELPKPERDLYTFAGWYSDAAFTKPYSTTTMPSATTMTLYAKWSINPEAIVITYHAKGGTAVNQSVGRAGDPLTLPTSLRDNFHFAGWYDSSYSTRYTAGVFPEASTTLYAKWEVVPQFVTFENVEQQEINPASDNPVSRRCRIVEDDVYEGKYALAHDWDYNPPAGGNHFALARAQVTDEHGNRIRLTSGKKYRVTFKYKVTKSDVNGLISLVLSGQNNTWGNWTEIVDRDHVIHVTSDMIGKGWLTATFDVTATPVNSDANYLSIGTASENHVIYDEIIVYELDSEFTYNGKRMVLFDSKGGSLCETVYGATGDAVTLPTPEREGYVFGGWCYDEEATDAVPDNLTITMGTVTLYADWYKDSTGEDPSPEDDGNDTVSAPSTPADTDTTDDSSDGPGIGLIIGIVAAAVVVIAVVVIVIVVTAKKKKLKPEETSETKSEEKTGEDTES